MFRFFVGIGAACAISIVGGVYADIYDDPVSRGRAMATFMVVSFRASLHTRLRC
jgi:MFS family permease